MSVSLRFRSSRHCGGSRLTAITLAVGTGGGAIFIQALRNRPAPVEVTTDEAAAYLRVLDDLVPMAAHVTEQYANNRIESDHGRL